MRRTSQVGRRVTRPAIADRPAAGRPAAKLTARTRLSTCAVCLAAALTAAAGSPQPATAHTGVPVGGPQLAGLGVIVNYPAQGAMRLPKVKASAWVVADAGTGQVLAARDPHGWYLPASTLKVLTAVTLMPVLNPDATVLTTRQVANQEPSKVGLKEGQSYRISDLFKAMLMISANDAAMSVAQATGSVSKGVAMMNAEAHHLQADDTVAKRPNGLNGPGQHVSAYDEALFARQALSIPEFMHDEALRIAKFPLKPHHRPITLYTQNTMMSTYRGDLGGKIGWTTASKTTYIGWARRGGHTLIVTILHCKPLTEMTYAARLLNWGFAMDGKIRPVGVLVPPLPAAAAAQPKATARPTPQALPSQALPPPAHLSTPGIPLLAGAGTLVLAALTGLVMAAVSRRRRWAVSAPTPGTPAASQPTANPPTASPPTASPPTANPPTAPSAANSPTSTPTTSTPAAGLPATAPPAASTDTASSDNTNSDHTNADTTSPAGSPPGR
jgi:D-alanyl-D-alanine carboxypeptidase (penicillin-binding protein 5/6)